MLIEFEKFNSKLLILLIFSIFNPLKRIIEVKINDNNYFEMFRFYLSYTLSFIFILIIKKRTKNNKKNIEINYIAKTNNSKKENWINPQDNVKKEIKKEKFHKQIFFIILLVLIWLILNIFNIIFKAIYSGKDINNILFIGKQSIGILFEIIYFILLSIFILKKKIYKHHLMSLIVISVNISLLIFSFGTCFPDNIIEVILYYFFSSFLFCLYYVVVKKYLNLFSNSPYNIMFNIGIISIIILFIYDIIAFLICRNDNTNIHGIIYGFKNNLELSFIFFFILDIIFNFLSNIGIWLTVYYFSPFHYIISESISEYLYYTYDCYINKTGYKLKDKIIYSIVYIINLIFFLIFNEIIILNFCGLSHNIKKNIEDRESMDKILTNQNEDIFLDSSNVSGFISNEDKNSNKTFQN